MYGNITQWLKNRNWESNELTYKLEKKRLISGAMTFHNNENIYLWGFIFNPSIHSFRRTGICLNSI